MPTAHVLMEKKKMHKIISELGINDKVCTGLRRDVASMRVSIRDTDLVVGGKRVWERVFLSFDPRGEV